MADDDIKVLPADEIGEKKIKWVVRELMGVELYPIIDGKKGDEPVPATEELVVGGKYTSCGLLGEYILWTVEQDTHGELTVNTGNTLGVLERGKDERNCWVVTGMINKRGIERLQLAIQSRSPETES